MKIGLDDKITTTLPAVSTAGKSSAADGGFERILNETVRNTPAGDPEAGKGGSPLIGGVSSVGFYPPFAMGNQPLADRVDHMLDSLDRYRQMLGDGSCTLRDMNPQVLQIAAEADSLQADLDTMPLDDELGTILNQTLITASLEVIKFNRGDYVAA